ncbi:hypothetical protein BH20PSE1_BH20PSE1_13470 [soil metagenome]
MTQTKRASARKPTRPQFLGWQTSDEQEIERRRQRAREETIRIEPLEPEHDPFGSFSARSASAEPYCVEIRSLGEHINSCDCPDHQVNSLGTCKHIEATLQVLSRRRRYQEARVRGNKRLEVFLDRRDARFKIQPPPRGSGDSEPGRLLADYFSSEGALLGDPLAALPAIERTIGKAPPRLRNMIRLSRHLVPSLAKLRHRAEQEQSRKDFEADVAAGKRSMEVLHAPLYPYQQEGMLHLAFSGRALLADEMGLGKTIQAIAACELLRRLRGIERVLVVAPASLKAEWEEQIAKFTALPALVIQGPRALRLKQYRQASFFYLLNYEQVRPDRHEINEVLAADVIVLDEAQRIKNWQTRTAEAVKRLTSRYAFVLTGTPVENRIDEIYSIVQFLDPSIFGPLFQFNRDFYALDERGRPVGYKNLDELHRRLRPLMLRRRKDEVEDQLPGRTVNTYFVAMAPEQATRYEEYETRVARLMAQAKRRPLLREEMEKLQKWLACMRMLCDTPYILDRDCRVAPKIDELRNVLDELMEGGDPKLIVFSEWERMLELVRVICEERGLSYAWHTGSTPQEKRRKEIRRFKDDTSCRLFLSTDAGSVGLNLQAANVVINLDLPWNPAKLEQRIARAWRKHQKRQVQVINLVTEHSIEHRMLSLLDQKRTLAAGVVDGRGEVREMTLPSGRAAFMERLQNLVGQTVASAAHAAPSRRDGRPEDQLREDALARWRERLDLLEVHRSDAKPPTVIAVCDRVDDALRQSITETVGEHLGSQSPGVEILDRATYETIQRLAATGLLTLHTGAAETLHRGASLAQEHRHDRHRRISEARKRFEEATRKQRMAQVLAEGGFRREALVPLREAAETGLQALLHLIGVDKNAPIPLPVLQANLTGMLPADAISTVNGLRDAGDDPSEDLADGLLRAGHRLLELAAEAFEKQCLGAPPARVGPE